MSPAELASPTEDHAAERDPPFSALERQVISLAEQAAVQGRPCLVGSHYLSRARRLLLGERLAPPLADPRLEALRRLACAVFSTGAVNVREAEAAQQAGVTPAQVEGIARMARVLARHRPTDRRLLLARRARGRIAADQRG